MTEHSDYYVYRLVDTATPVGPGQGAFYIGKGRGSRWADHVKEVALLNAEKTLELLRRAATDSRVDLADPSKAERLAELLNHPGRLRVDILARDLPQHVALSVEAAAIDAIGVEHLTNRVRGHHSACQPLRALSLSDQAQKVPLTDVAVIVAISGIWAPGDYLEGLSVLDDDKVWMNARQAWPLAGDVRAIIEQRAASYAPVRLLAVHTARLQSGTATVLGGIVMGEWYVGGTRLHSSQGGTRRWRFEAHQSAPEPRYLHQRLLTTNGRADFRFNQGAVYSGALHALRAPAGIVVERVGAAASDPANT
ncbi:hypothetical protein [Streptomyces sp. NPDC048386]|uniref:LEM-3-like GIY-YIG domain-containing protein n=1 Tax=Streptomyces sp. NPDC048386 TaxID=3365541 RepID=UPI0037110B1C